jgi:ABC-type antimicrobial peptide transport system ATPase subunit
MMPFTDYAYYTAHGGQLPEAKYNAAVYDAYAEIVSQTNGAATTAPDSMLESVKLCECKLADLIGAYQAGDSLLPKGIGNVNNDGYSVSRAAGADTARQEAKERRDICARYLQAPVNLMGRWL